MRAHTKARRNLKLSLIDRGMGLVEATHGAKEHLLLGPHILQKAFLLLYCLCRPKKCQKRPTIGAKETYYIRTLESLPAVAPAAVAAPDPPCIVAAADSRVYIHVSAQVHQVNAIHTHTHVRVRAHTHSCTRAHTYAHIWQHFWPHSVLHYYQYHYPHHNCYYYNYHRHHYNHVNVCRANSAGLERPGGV